MEMLYSTHAFSYRTYDIDRSTKTTYIWGKKKKQESAITNRVILRECNIMTCPFINIKNCNKHLNLSCKILKIHNYFFITI